MKENKELKDRRETCFICGKKFPYASMHIIWPYNNARFEMICRECGHNFEDQPEDNENFSSYCNDRNYMAMDS